MKSIKDLVIQLKSIEQELTALDNNGTISFTVADKRHLIESISALLIEIALLENAEEKVIEPWPGEQNSLKPTELAVPIIEHNVIEKIKATESPSVEKVVPAVDANITSKSKTTLQDSAAQQNKQGSINDKMGHSGDKNLSDKLRDKPISKLQQGVPLNDKILIIRHLFKGNTTLYENTIRQLDTFNNASDASQYIKEVLLPTHHWDTGDEVLQILVSLVNRRYLA